MKHLKLFKENNEYYQKVDRSYDYKSPFKESDDWNFYKDYKHLLSNLENLINIKIEWFNSGKLICIIDNYKIYITKTDDNWYILTLYKNNSGPVSRYRCDQIEGVIEFIKGKFVNKSI